MTMGRVILGYTVFILALFLALTVTASVKVALWIADPNDEDFREGMVRFEGWIWEDDEQGARVAGARSAT